MKIDRTLSPLFKYYFTKTDILRHIIRNLAHNTDEPEIFGYYGKEAKYTNPAWTKPDHVSDNWAKPTVNVTGNYKLIFDAHLERAKLIPAN